MHAFTGRRRGKSDENLVRLEKLKLASHDTRLETSIDQCFYTEKKSIAFTEPIS